MNNNIELQILSCLLLKPELMENNKLEDKYFKHTQRLWRFMKTFYNKFKTFDAALMISVASNQYKMADYIAMLFEYEPAPSNFEKYQDRLIEIYYKNKKEEWIINKIYDLSNELLVGLVKLDDFKEKLENIYKIADNIKWEKE